MDLLVARIPIRDVSTAESRHRVDLDATIKTLADTGKDMNSKYKETGEAGLAANLVLC